MHNKIKQYEIKTISNIKRKKSEFIRMYYSIIHLHILLASWSNVWSGTIQYVHFRLSLSDCIRYWLHANDINSNDDVLLAFPPRFTYSDFTALVAFPRVSLLKRIYGTKCSCVSIFSTYLTINCVNSVYRRKRLFYSI